MVKRRKTSAATEDHENGMTVGSRDGIGVHGVNNSFRKHEGCDEEESGDQGSEERSTKRDGMEILDPSTTGSTSLPLVLPTPVPNQSGSGLTQRPQTSSVPFLQNHDQHHFLRSSVRPPSKRIRKDSIATTINGHGHSKLKGSENGPSAQVASGQPGPVSGPGGAKAASRSQGPSDKEELGGIQKRARRQWESWSADDKNSFFEGLYEHGKDFEAIQTNIALKYRKKGKPASMVKNKEQVRHFYYRTWHKISKHIDFANVSRVLKRSSQELYGLICYSELRKKVGGLMDDKNVAKLNELIQQGATTVRSKGRNLRIKAPMCRAIKRLCDPDGVSDEEDQKPVRLPLKVAVELQPRSNHSWARVQSLAHNPRLRMVVELHRKVSSLIEFLKQKWAVQDQRILKSLQESEALGSQQALPAPCKPELEELFLYPAQTSPLATLPGVARIVHSKASCTVHWQESGRCRPGAKELPGVQILGIHGAAVLRGPARTARGAAASAPPAEAPPAPGPEEKSTGPSPAPPPTTQRPLTSRQEAGGGSGDRGRGFSEGGEGCGEPIAKEGERDLNMQGSSVDKCGEECMAGVSTTSPGVSTTSPESHLASEEPVLELGSTVHPGKEESGEAPAAPGGRSAQQIREEGWSAGGSVTLAELYLMLGKPGKLQLEYEWQPAVPSGGQDAGQPSHLHPAPPANTHRVLRCLLRLAASQINPKAAPELCSTATSPLKPPQEEQSPAPPGRSPAGGGRSPNCSRQQASLRGAKVILPSAGPSGVRNLPRSLLVSGGDAEGGVFAVPTTLPPNSSRHSRMFSPNKEAELAFRQQLDSISSDIFLSKQRKFRSRQLRKPLVVQRTLLPRTTGDAPQHVCSFSILSNSAATGTGSFRPIQTRLPNCSRPPLTKSSIMSGPVNSSKLSSAIDLAAKSAGIIPGSPCRELEAGGPCRELEAGGPCRELETGGPCRELETGGPCRELEAVGPCSLLAPEPAAHAGPQTQFLQEDGTGTGPSPGGPCGGDSLLSPPSVASLLDISLPGPPEEALVPGEPQTHISDSIIELAINSAHYGDEASLCPAKLNGSSKLLPSSPSVSPSRGWIPSPCHDPQWYPNDSTDSSLGCLLSSLVSPDKGRRTLARSGPSSGTALLGPSLLDCNSHDSFQSRGLPDVAEVDTQLACMMSESSVDYIARFNDLAQELSVTESPLPPPGV
ncbi:protein cramped-like [Osmerus eperlanus]|uniref:protein cramped-like n=1 Tax=Osmerus eperlanus TaxID=29151 RepID=UPI002E118CD2